MEHMQIHYSDVIMGTMACLINSLTIFYSSVYSGGDQRKYQMVRVTGLCAGNSPETVEFPAQMASNAKNVSIWWRHHVLGWTTYTADQGWEIFCDFDVNWDVLQSWYIFTCSDECQILFYGGRGWLSGLIWIYGLDYFSWPFHCQPRILENVYLGTFWPKGPRPQTTMMWQRTWYSTVWRITYFPWFLSKFFQQC